LKDVFKLTFPEAEAKCLRQAYEGADVILEYGSGGSTVLAANLPDKLIFSVESDRDWARDLQAELDRVTRKSPAIVSHIDIGPTGMWGRPLDASHWQDFHRLPMDIWDEPFFRHPDVVLVDGRFRAACLVATCLRITKPVQLLFDDYIERPIYQTVEKIIKPTRTVGRMAVFDLTPGLITPELMGFAISTFAWATFVSKRGVTDYSLNGFPLPPQGLSLRPEFTEAEKYL